METLKRLVQAGICVLMILNLGCCGLFVSHIPQGQIPSPGPYDHLVKVDDVRFHYLEYPGEGRDPAEGRSPAQEQGILMLHGLGSSTYTWEKVAPILQREGYHVWALDLKGFGWSDKPKGAAYDPLTLMRDVNRWMTYMGLKDMVMVGNSLGGAVSALLSVEHPDKVSCMVLVDPGGYPTKLPTIVKLGKLPFAPGVVKLLYGRWLIKWNLRQVMYHDDWITKEQVEAYYDRNRTENGIDAQIALMKTLNYKTFDRFIKRVPEATKKTLLIWGRDDVWVPLEAVGYRFRRDLPNASLVAIPECGHIPQEEKPELTASLILDFLAGRPIKETPVPQQQ